MSERNFFSELKRRNVYKVAVAYAIVAWLLIQAASILFPTFEAPAWVMKVFVTAIIFGFPVALILAWAFELTPEGIKRAEDVLPNESITRKTGRKLIGTTIVLAVIAAGLLAFQFLRPKTTTTAPGKIDRGAAVRKPERGKIERVFRRRHSGRNIDALIQDRRLEGDLAHIDPALQKRAGKSARDRPATWRRKHR